MAFHSLFFLFAFLPVALILYHLAPSRFKAPVLLALSLFFYAWGDPASLLLLCLSIVFNYGAGLYLGNSRDKRLKQQALAAAILANIAVLIWYKYFSFLLQGFFELHWLPDTFSAVNRHLPMGISFFTFSAISYQIDIYRGAAAAEKNIITFGAYIALFQKIVAGPLARYSDFARDLKRRTITLEGFADGVQLFILGLGKKLLIANTLGQAADQVFNLHGPDIDMPTAWLGIICYTLQIYFDFSGYTDMAVGLGRMFGLRLPDNFNYPYTAQSIREFWQRWHISLSAWLRDYVYIPLGGSRCSLPRVCLNLGIVFLVCGLWHGASWGFIVWGLYHGLLLILERLGLARLLAGLWRPLRHCYVVVAVMVGWVFFRAEDLLSAMEYLRAMASGTGCGPGFEKIFCNRQLFSAAAAALLLSTPVWQYVNKIKAGLCLDRAGLYWRLAHAGSLGIGLVLLFIIFTACIMQLAGETNSPFIYAQF